MSLTKMRRERATWRAREVYRLGKYRWYRDRSKHKNRVELRKKWWRLWDEATTKRKSLDRQIAKSKTATSISSKGINLIAKYEGFVGHAYKPVPGERYWTIGYGHYGPDVRPGQRITKTQARKLLRKDVARFEAAVRRLVKVPVNQNRFDALVSFAFNVGEGALAGSTLLRKLNASDYDGAADEFLKWDKGAGGRLAGLTRRRREERALFNRPV